MVAREGTDHDEHVGVEHPANGEASVGEAGVEGQGVGIMGGVSRSADGEDGEIAIALLSLDGLDDALPGAASPAAGEG